MKCQIPEISWHNRDPVLSVDIQPKGSNDRDDQHHRLASGGTDSHVLIWYMVQNPDCGTITLDLAADLTRHQRAVNAVRWSPSGDLLASGDDESVIFIWKQKGESEVVNILDTTNEQDKEIWLTMKILRGHMEDVYDLSWSANSAFLISGSVDNTAIVWDVMRGKSQAILQDHKGFVQGVAWDPQDKYVATLSTDRYFRVFDIQSKRVVSRSNKCTLPVPAAHQLHGKTVRLFHDDTLQTFFRRLSFSPDGNLIVTPSGVAEIEGLAKPLNTTYIYTRNSLRQPAITLPSPDQYTVAVRFCPVFFQHWTHTEAKQPIIPLPYRMVFAVATKSSVYLYDTQQTAPFALISNIHYTRLTDMAWSSDGKILIVSSTDGFCSLIYFSDGELGLTYVPPTTEPAELSAEGKQNGAEATGSDNAREGGTDAKPIAFRRKPKPMDAAEIEGKTKKETVDSEQPLSAKQDTEKIAKPIAFRRKPKSVEPMEVDDEPEEHPTGDGSPSAQLEKVVQPGVEFIIEKDKIISSAEKFDSPAKKDRPVTPIAVRRHPRTPSDAQPSPPGASTTAPSSSSSVGKNIVNPIAIRRYPRTPVGGGDGEKQPAKRIIEPTAEEDANDTWPIDQPKPQRGGTTEKRNQPATAPISLVDTEQTEDIVLLVESDDEQHDAPAAAASSSSATTTPKTPRRVEFRTISTPKSKKKLL
ncbi:chromatin assembly factor 1 subunit B [Anopheles bellator]|uniref:chromatin assembly factor 1 subunit B n=1 Tax=Anopheles bellator TaxID=139047 RepID=UPI002648C81C|nr:chromatin assembly factor 1 subunit B [Anopheles bellator]